MRPVATLLSSPPICFQDGWSLPSACILQRMDSPKDFNVWFSFRKRQSSPSTATSGRRFASSSSISASVAQSGCQRTPALLEVATVSPGSGGLAVERASWVLGWSHYAASAYVSARLPTVAGSLLVVPPRTLLPWQWLPACHPASTGAHWSAEPAHASSPPGTLGTAQLVSGARHHQRGP